MLSQKLSPSSFIITTIILITACSDPTAPDPTATAPKSTTQSAKAYDFSALEAAINAGDAILAQQLLAQAQQQTSTSADRIAEYQIQLDKIIASAAQRYLEQAQQLMEVAYQPLESGQTDQPRQQLQSAHEAIQKAKSLEQSNPGIQLALNNLEKKYLSMIESAADDRAYNRAKSFIEDSLTMELKQEGILASGATIDKAIMRKARSINPMPM
ncbi:hypothetical protein [Oceanicoccus sp. KOV_DT_Chl]|uniref:hypothetical protein n=1 Tax=Oceanicoccus sp. KOV_DT_Chl TaxID=1904639 RepID=UPI000C7D368C|nr:hypothetical protein [Oceanicoccus sp. KOV_DT_Chl]